MEASVADSYIQWNKDGLNQISKLQRQASKEAQDIILQVNAEMAGQPEANIFNELRNRICRAGFEPNDPNLRVVAKAISERNLR
jgi:hypothetical protein